MPISEKQLETWSHQGSITQSKQTYASVKSVLEDPSAPYNGRSYSNFLQGSYGNDTNIYADSDVDIVMMLDDIYYTDLDHLTEEEKNRYLSARSTASYTFAQFKAEVFGHLASKYGSSVTLGKKAILIEGSGGRRDCDVLVCTELRRYVRFNSFSDQEYHTGICFWTTDGVRITNFPRQHSVNCTKKHQDTNSWFNPSVRILKNMRNSMIEKGYIEEGLAPSYFLEGMLYNVPNGNFGVSYQDTIAQSINWLLKSDRSKLLCANELYFLCHPSSLVTWRAEKLQAYLDAVVKYWNNWPG